MLGFELALENHERGMCSWLARLMEACQNVLLEWFHLSLTVEGVWD